jgi:hypothetical protein
VWEETFGVHCNPFRPAQNVLAHTVIRFVSIRAKFGISTVTGLNGTLVEAKIRKFKWPNAYFSFNKCPI